MKRITNIGIGFALAFFTLLLNPAAKAQTPAAGQSQDQSSLGDYARKVHKDSGPAKPRPKVFDNDNIPKDEKISIVGVQPAADTSASPTANDKDSSGTKPANSSNDEQAKKQAAWKQWQDKVSGQKQQIDLAGRELDVLQREYELRAAAMYADAGNRLRNSAQWDKQEAQYKQQIADKQKAVDDAKQKLQDLQEEARKAGVPSSMID